MRMIDKLGWRIFFISTCSMGIILIDFMITNEESRDLYPGLAVFCILIGFLMRLSAISPYKLAEFWRKIGKKWNIILLNWGQKKPAWGEWKVEEQPVIQGTVPPATHRQTYGSMGGDLAGMLPSRVISESQTAFWLSDAEKSAQRLIFECSHIWKRSNICPWADLCAKTAFSLRDDTMGWDSLAEDHLAGCSPAEKHPCLSRQHL